MINFSLLLNTRKRPILLKNLLDSIIWTTNDLSKIEVLISADADDTLTQSYFNQYHPTWNGFLPSFATIEYIERDRNLHRRINNLILKSNGKYVLSLNDDCEIDKNSINWDLKSFELLENSFNDNIVCANVSCTSIDKEKSGQYSSFPIVSRRAIDILGQLISEDLPGLGGDVYLWRIFSAINRIINVPLQIRHILHEDIQQILNCDETAKEMRQITYQSKNCWDLDVSKEIERLKNNI